MARELTSVILSELRNVESRVRAAGNHIHQLKQWYESQRAENPRWPGPTLEQALELLQKAQSELDQISA